MGIWESNPKSLIFAGTGFFLCSIFANEALMLVVMFFSVKCDNSFFFFEPNKRWVNFKSDKFIKLLIKKYKLNWDNFQLKTIEIVQFMVQCLSFH